MIGLPFPLLGGKGTVIIPSDITPGDQYTLMGKYQRDLSRTPRMFRLTPPDTANTDIGDFGSNTFTIRRYARSEIVLKKRG
jgi:hypothetical protein